MEVKECIIEGVDYSYHIPYPVKQILTLDESLDTAIFQIVGFPNDNLVPSTPFKPFTPVTLIMTDNAGTENTYYMSVAIDKVNEIVQGDRPIHNITLIEETKILERLLIGGKTVTNPSSRIYKNALPIHITEVQNSGGGFRLLTSEYPYIQNDTLYSRNFSPTNPGRFYVYPATSLANFTGGANDKATVSIYFENTLLDTRETLEGFYFNITEPGNYKIVYNMSRTITVTNTLTAEINFLVTNSLVFYSRFNIPSADLKVPEEWLKPILQNTVINLSSFADVFPTGDEFTFIIESPNGTQQITYGHEQTLQYQNITLSQLGIYTFYVRSYASAGGLNNQFIMRFNVMTQEQINNFTYNQKTITDVVQTILNTYQPLYVGELPIISFNEDDAEYYSKVEAPQFSFTNQMSLWEVFSIIGDFIHAIPRLKNNVLNFDKLGGIELANLNFDNYVVNEQSYSVEQFCSELVSTVENLVNYEKDGSIIEPGNNYKTLRIEQGQAYIEEGQLLIATSEPIEELKFVECGILSDGTKVGDITDYCYERAEYNVLSSYDDVYPNAKCYAIYWTQGERNIKGLTFKKPELFNSVFEDYAIQNIIQQVTGKNNNWFVGIFKNELSLQNLMFRVGYIPRFTAKVKQKKTLLNDIKNISQLAINQSSTLVDSSALGENLKGTVARLGNIDLVRTYIFHSLAEIPKMGSIVVDKNENEYYISNMILEYYQNFIQVEIAFSKEFNRRSEFVGIKNQLRFSEVDVSQVLDRHINFEDYCIIGDEYTGDSNTVIKRNAFLKLAMSFVNNTLGQQKIKNVISKTSNDNVNYINVLLPVTSIGLGNSILFSCAYEDNFSAGDKIVELSSFADRDNNVTNRVQQQVQYSNYLGEAKYLKFDFFTNISEFLDYNSLKNFGDVLPQIPETLSEISQDFSTPKPIQLEKDNREKINVNYQLHFVTNKKNIIIGSALASRNILVSILNPNFKLYVSPKRLFKFEQYIDTTGMTEFTLDRTSILDSVNNNGFNLGEFTSTVGGMAWVIVNEQKNRSEVVLGQNMAIEKGQLIKLPFFNFTHKI